MSNALNPWPKLQGDTTPVSMLLLDGPKVTIQGGNPLFNISITNTLSILPSAQSALILASKPVRTLSLQALVSQLTLPKFRWLSMVWLAEFRAQLYLQSSAAYTLNRVETQPCCQLWIHQPKQKGTLVVLDSLTLVMILQALLQPVWIHSDLRCLPIRLT